MSEWSETYKGQYLLSIGVLKGKEIFCPEQLESTSAPYIPGVRPVLSSGLNIFRGADTILISTYKFI